MSGQSKYQALNNDNGKPNHESLNIMPPISGNQVMNDEFESGIHSMCEKQHATTSLLYNGSSMFCCNVGVPATGFCVDSQQCSLEKKKKTAESCSLNRSM